MLSAKLLTDLHLVMCAVRNNRCPFGGMQVICSGDFLQLPPVPCARFLDDGDFAFVSPVWRHTFHKVKLTDVVRQQEAEMTQV